MTNQEKDLQNAREYLDKQLPELNEDDYIIYPILNDSSAYCIDEVLANYVQWLEQKGEIKFTGKRS